MRPSTWQRFLLLLLIGVCSIVLIGESLLSSSRWINQPFPGFFVHENLTVGPYSLPGWTGRSAGLESLDRIVRTADQPIESRGEIYESARKLPVGTPMRYQVARGERVYDLTISTMRFTFSDWLFSFGVYNAIGFAFLVIGVAPYFYRASSPVALPLCFMVLAAFVWFQTTFDFMTAGLFPKELRTFALTLTPSAGIHLALLLRAASLNIKVRPVFIGFIYSVGLAVAALNSWTFFGPVEIWIAHFRASYLYVFIGAAGFLLITGNALRRRQTDLDRSRLRVMFVGALLGFLLPALMTVLTSLFHFQIAYNLALIPAIFFPVSVAYALLKYSLFDLGNALRIGLSRLALMATLVAIYAAITYLLAPWIGVYARNPLVPIFFSILVVAIFNPLLHWLENLVDWYIYRHDYDPGKLQADTSLFLRTLDGAPALAEGFIQRIAQPMKIRNALVMYRPVHTGDIITAGRGAVAALPPTAKDDFEVIARFLHGAVFRGVSRDEVSTHPGLSEHRERLLRAFDRFHAELIFPLVYERGVRGLVSFGAKQSGREYSAEDLRLLATLTDQLALSLENGRLYEESVAARRKAEESNKRLLEMDRIKKDFVANICHELRTPVSTIIGYGEVLRDPGFKGDARDILDRLVTNGQELSNLMDNLMNFSRMEADGNAPHFEIVKLTEILAALEMMTQRLIRERPIEFGIHVDSTVDTIESDGQKLQQILVQLLTNALKFTQKGRIELSLRKQQREGRELLEIAVADTGIGIKREDQEIIFDDFRQVDGSSTRAYGGTGLGLGLCKKLAAALGGEIRVASEYGVGSVFSLLLPLRTPELATGS